MNISINMSDLAKRLVFICCPWPDVTKGSLKIKAKRNYEKTTLIYTLIKTAYNINNNS